MQELVFDPLRALISIMIGSIVLFVVMSVCDGIGGWPAFAIFALCSSVVVIAGVNFAWSDDV